MRNKYYKMIKLLKFKIQKIKVLFNKTINKISLIEIIKLKLNLKNWIVRQKAHLSKILNN